MAHAFKVKTEATRAVRERAHPRRRPAKYFQIHTSDTAPNILKTTAVLGPVFISKPRETQQAFLEAPSPVKPQDHCTAVG